VIGRKSSAIGILRLLYTNRYATAAEISDLWESKSSDLCLIRETYSCARLRIRGERRVVVLAPRERMIDEYALLDRLYLVSFFASKLQLLVFLLSLLSLVFSFYKITSVRKSEHL
jgi:hypothetical protein